MDQEGALEVLKTGKNVFLTGEPGAGKTFVTNQYIDWLQAYGIKVAITASTGIAATHIGGRTIHSWSGMGIRSRITDIEVEDIVSKKQVYDRINETEVLIIDEISMLSADMLNGLDKVCRAGKEDSLLPFGGIQIIASGDFFQLPPIFGQGEHQTTGAIYAFQAGAWNKAEFLVCYLTEQHRQVDTDLLNILRAIRSDVVEDEHYRMLGDQKEIEYSNCVPTRLYTHNKNVDIENNTELETLEGDKVTFIMIKKGTKSVAEVLAKNCISPETLDLKKNASVMFTKNNPSEGFMNGTLGKIVGFDTKDGLPIVETHDGKEIKAFHMDWEVTEGNKVIASIRQIPLRLAWAITIHKSQGFSLDAAHINLSTSFVEGQGYVALSRVRTLRGMKLKGINNTALKVSEVVLQQDSEFRIKSEKLQEAVEDEVRLQTMRATQKRFVEGLGHTLKKEGWKKKKIYSQTINTLEQTKDLIIKGIHIPDIATKRDLKETTILNHIEKLAETNMIAQDNIQHIKHKHQNEFQDNRFKEIQKAIRIVGDEKLTLIFKYLKEKYDYDTIRLARIIYRLDNNKKD